MSSERLSDAIGMIDDDIIEAADKARSEVRKRRKTPLWIGIGSMAACAAIITTVALNNIGQDKIPTENMSGNADESTASEIMPDSGGNSDEIPTEGGAATETFDEEECVDCGGESNEMNPSVGWETTDSVATAEMDDIPCDAVETMELIVDDMLPDDIEEEAAAETIDAVMETAEAVLESSEMAVEETEDCIEDVVEEEEDGTAESPDVIEPELSLGKSMYSVDYPEFSCPDEWDYTDYKEYRNAVADYEMQLAELNRYNAVTSHIPQKFVGECLNIFLSQSNGENAAFSPANVYMALSVLAETTSGSTQQKILDVLGMSDMTVVRKAANGLFGQCYSRKSVNTSFLGASLWKDDTLRLNGSPAQLQLQNILAKYYYAPMYNGDVTNAEYSEVMQEWLNRQTGGVLDVCGDVDFDPDTVLSLITTVYFKAQWADCFDFDKTAEGVFRKTDGTEITAQFMNDKHELKVCFGEGFSAIKLDLADGDSMWFFLPDEGITPEQLVADGDFFYNESWRDEGYYNVNISIPKFDVSTCGDITEYLKQLGVTEAFGGSADFSALTQQSMALSEVVQAVRIAVGENGVTAASCIKMDTDGAAAPNELLEFDFILDRPFLFAVQERKTEMPLFCGIVNQP